MQIVNYSDKYKDFIIDGFVDSFAEDDRDWTVENASYEMFIKLKDYENYSFVALGADQKPIGYILAGTRPVLDTKELFIETLFVSSEHRGKKIAKALMSKLMNKIEPENFYCVRLEADSKVEFPLEWYKKLGFTQSRWLSFETKPEIILDNLDE